MHFYIDQRISSAPLLGMNQDGIFGASWDVSDGATRLTMYFLDSERARLSAVPGSRNKCHSRLALAGHIDDLVRAMSQLKNLALGSCVIGDRKPGVA